MIFQDLTLNLQLNLQELVGGVPIANLLTGLGMDEVFSRTDSAGTRAFLPDALGSTLALTDSLGSVQTQYTYEPFGQTTVMGAASGNSIQYAGRENDGTGLYYYRARYYHPGLQRFISEDPIEFEGGDVNLYGYVLNDPVNLVDPFGRFSIAGAIPAICVENPAACIGAIATGYVICRLMGRCQLPPPEYHSEGTGEDPKGPGKRRKNRIPDRGKPNTVCPNPSGTTKKRYGPDGWVQKEWNKGHGPDAPPEEQDDHIHDYTPNPYHPEGRPTRGDGRPPRPGELEEFE